MADAADDANDRIATETEIAIRNTACEVPPGYPGECDTCGEHSSRLIQGMCAPCRDKYMHKFRRRTD